MLILHQSNHITGMNTKKERPYALLSTPIPILPYLKR